ncbi:MAG: hypothetical protein KGV59_05760 [Tenacibaculum sp.]|nr:hypothetical protein [Tenacibaculum sp.]
MKKVFLLFLLFVLKNSFSQNYIEKYIDTINVSSTKLFGKVKSVKDRTYKVSYKEGEIVEGEILQGYPGAYWSKIFLKYGEDILKTNIDYVFDKEGKITEKIIEGFDVIVYTYGGKLSKEARLIVFTNKKIYFETEYNYDKNGNLLSYKKFRDLDLYESAFFTYENNNLTKYTLVDAEGNIEEKHTYTYKNDKIKSKYIYETEMVNKLYEYDDNGNVVYFFEKTKDFGNTEKKYKYDDLGRKIKEKVYRTEYNTNSIYETIYCNDGKISAILYKNKDGGLVGKEVYEYFDDEYLVKTYIDYVDGKELRKVSKYLKGLLTYIEEGNDVFEYKYKFDNKDNWIEVIEFKNKIPLRMRKREITYFN